MVHKRPSMGNTLSEELLKNGADEGDGSPEQAAGEAEHLPDPEASGSKYLASLEWPAPPFCGACARDCFEGFVFLISLGGGGGDGIAREGAVNKSMDGAGLVGGDFADASLESLDIAFTSLLVMVG
uniref:Uncharacterized protein n=1 Tax=Oryza meridionalis TaxID=40149 RepID=A0A0E0DL06_9ORYZ